MNTDTTDIKHSDHDSTANGSWEGAARPFKVGYGKLMIWMYLSSHNNYVININMTYTIKYTNNPV